MKKSMPETNIDSRPFRERKSLGKFENKKFAFFKDILINHLFLESFDCFLEIKYSIQAFRINF